VFEGNRSSLENGLYDKFCYISGGRVINNKETVNYFVSLTLIKNNEIGYYSRDRELVLNQLNVLNLYALFFRVFVTIKRHQIKRLSFFSALGLSLIAECSLNVID
jgi:hypothetical protein